MSDHQDPQRYPETNHTSESGQTIVILAFTLIGLLLFVGLAVDVGFAFARSAQLQSAVDAATMAGSTELHLGVATAEDRAVQFMNTNNWPVENAVVYSSTETYNVYGLPEYTFTVTWPVELFFMRIISFNEVPVTESGSAAYYAMTDLYTPTGKRDQGAVVTAGQFTFGADSCTQLGDAVTPRKATNSTGNPTYSILDGTYTYRIRIPPTYESNTGSTLLEVQLFDPDGYNQILDNVSATHSNAFGGSTFTALCGTNYAYSCSPNTGEGFAANIYNPVWHIRVDEAWDPGCPGAVTPNGGFNNETVFELYEYQNNGSRNNFSRYIARGWSADLLWVTPRSGDPIAPTDYGNFVVNVSTLSTDEFGFRYVYLDVSGVGSTKNVFDIFAAPPTVIATYPANVNERNLRIANIRYANLTDPRNAPTFYGMSGLDIFAVGYMPVSFYRSSNVSFPLAPIDDSKGDSRFYASAFDFDNGASTPIRFSLDSLSDVNVVATAVNNSPNPAAGQFTCNNSTNCDNTWFYPQVQIPIPSSDYGFYGGNLYVQYTPNKDSHTWSMSVTDGKPFLTR
ncbi:MAG TPA: pilus assembly protein TadG-related protein [Anaerolineae bacterium]|nr:pilus assembly protein TadG-related protein [Anaerolineae bacterium]